MEIILGANERHLKDKALSDIVTMGSSGDNFALLI